MVVVVIFCRDEIAAAEAARRDALAELERERQAARLAAQEAAAAIEVLQQVRSRSAQSVAHFIYCSCCCVFASLCRRQPKPTEQLLRMAGSLCLCLFCH